jgi:hypothetical protein
VLGVNSLDLNFPFPKGLVVPAPSTIDAGGHTSYSECCDLDLRIQMTPVPFIEEIIAQYDSATDPFDLTVLRSRLFDEAKKHQLNEPDRAAVHADVSALGFRPFREDNSEWGTHFGPWYMGQKPDGTAIHDPDLKTLSGASIDAWIARAETVRNPLLKSRYADVVWDLQRKLVPDRGRPYQFARMAADAYLALASSNANIHSVFHLQRAISLAQQINDRIRTLKIVDQMIELAGSATLQQPGIWTVAFDHGFGKTHVTPAHNEMIVSQLEDRLAGAATARDGFRAEIASSRLAKVYRIRGDRDNLVRVVRIAGEVYFQMAESASSSLAIGWLQPVIEKYLQEGLRAEADRLRVYTEKRARTVRDEMKQQSYEISIDKQEVEDYLDTLIQGDNAHAALFRVVQRTLPAISETRRRMKEAAETFTAHRLIPTVLVGEHGHPVAALGSYEEDEDGRLINNLAQELGMMPFLFWRGYQKVKEKFGVSIDELVNSLRDSLLFKPDRLEFFVKGFAAYEAEDYIAAIHILVPQVENLLRGFLELLGVPITKTVGGFTELKNLDDVLRDDRLKESLDEQWWLVFKTVFSDKRGFNLRNEMAHGIAPLDAFNPVTAGLVLQSVVLLSAVRLNAMWLEKDSDAAKPD